MTPTKPELRQTLKQARLAISSDLRTSWSAATVSKLINQINWSEMTKIHCYEPIAKLGEVDIYPLIEFLSDEHPNIEIFTTRKIDNNWEIVSINGGSIPEIPKFDAVIVPMLGFDEELNRIGYGGGYYDKFLASQPGAQKAGVCYEQGRTGRIPTEAHDIKLDLIITQNHTYKTI